MDGPSEAARLEEFSLIVGGLEHLVSLLPPLGLDKKGSSVAFSCFFKSFHSSGIHFHEVSGFFFAFCCSRVICVGFAGVLMFSSVYTVLRWGCRSNEPQQLGVRSMPFWPLRSEPSCFVPMRREEKEATSIPGDRNRSCRGRSN